jgi:FAD/FMN-containing dehydrogenase
VAGAVSGQGGVAFDACGGAINRVGPGDTAFVHRNALFLAQYTLTWDTGAVTADIDQQAAWQRDLYASMRPYASGQAYQNYIDPSLTNWRQAYYGANYQRLTQVKATYDPDHLFQFPQAIG